LRVGGLVRNLHYPTLAQWTFLDDRATPTSHRSLVDAIELILARVEMAHQFPWPCLLLRAHYSNSRCPVEKLSLSCPPANSWTIGGLRLHITYGPRGVPRLMRGCPTTPPLSVCNWFSQSVIYPCLFLRSRLVSLERPPIDPRTSSKFQRAGRLLTRAAVPGLTW